MSASTDAISSAAKAQSRSAGLASGMGVFEYLCRSVHSFTILLQLQLRAAKPVSQGLLLSQAIYKGIT